MSAKARSMHSCLHDYAQETQLGSQKSSTCPSCKRIWSNRIYPRRRPQPAGTLNCVSAWRSCKRPSRCSLSPCPWCSWHIRCWWPQAEKVKIRNKKTKEVTV